MWVNTRHYAVQLWVNTRHLTLAWHFTRTTCLLVIMRWKYQLFHKPGKPYKNFYRLIRNGVLSSFWVEGINLPSSKTSQTIQRWEHLASPPINLFWARLSERFTAARKERKVIRGCASCRSWSQQMVSKEEERRTENEGGRTIIVWWYARFKIVYLGLSSRIFDFWWTRCDLDFGSIKIFWC